MVTSDSDLIVVGGGPVGLATAIEARLRGIDVAVIEPRGGPIDKACGESLMPGALDALRCLGVDPPGHRLEGVRYCDARRSVSYRFAGHAGLGVRRTALHDALAERARALGVVRHAGRVSRLTQDHDRVVVAVRAAPEAAVSAGSGPEGRDFPPAIEPREATMAARWVIAADGLHSPLRRLVGIGQESPLPRNRRRFGLRAHFQIEPWTSLVEVYWGAGGEAYVTPVGSDLVGVAMLAPAGAAFTARVAAIPSLVERLGGAAIVGSVRGAGPLDQRTRRRVVGRVLFVGDAAGYVDALTGEGLRVGFAQARAAIDAIISADPASYERAWVRATRDYRMLTSGLVAVARSPMRRAIVPAASALPAVFGSIIERLAR
jgi:flavin-dependent dehydrogenase